MISAFRTLLLCKSNITLTTNYLSLISKSNNNMQLTKDQASLAAGTMENRFSKEKGLELFNRLKGCPDTGIEISAADVATLIKKMEYTKKNCVSGKYFAIKEALKAALTAA